MAQHMMCDASSCKAKVTHLLRAVVSIELCVVFLTVSNCPVGLYQVITVVSEYTTHHSLFNSSYTVVVLLGILSK